jgi:multidrug efflux system membrane fusion protein
MSSIPAGAAPASPPLLRRWTFWVPVAIAALLLIVFIARRGHGDPKPATRAVPVVVMAAKQGDMPVVFDGLGTVTPTDAVTVRSRVDGQLMRMAFTEGQYVHKGELLAEIDPRPFQVQLAQAEGQMAKDQAALKNAQRDLVRFKDLAGQGILPQQQLDTQQSAVDQAAASVKSDQGSVASARLNLTYSRITAPTEGRVGLRLVDPGNIVHASDANGLLVITPVHPITVLFTLPADQVPMVQAKVRAGRKLAVEAYDRDMKTKLADGTLLALDNQVDTSTGTVKLKALFPNRNDALFPNQFVNARLSVDTLRSVVMVPAAAVQRGTGTPFVYVIKGDDTVELREVDILLTDGETVALGKGVAPGEMVVVDGVDKLRPGMKVAPSPEGAREGGASRNPRP